MTSAPKPRISIIGAGLMGHGIAYLFAATGHEVRVHDTDTVALEQLPRRLGVIRDLLAGPITAADRVSGHISLPETVEQADVVIEAAAEKIEIKRLIFSAFERHAPKHAILASNTSVIPISRIAEDVADKSRVIGAHFWNPPHLVRLVEVVVSAESSRPAALKMVDLLRAVGHHPVLVNRDIPGFIGNRLQHALKREAIALVAAGVCDAETVDDVVKLGFGARLAVLGPLEQSDMVGLQLTKNIHDVLISDLDVTPHTHPYLDALVAKGDIGMKRGRGFREWTPEQAQAVRDRLSQFLADAAAREAKKA
ncbi:MAG TPA: 3-hydroxyacyl-CoA dehydrogenase NAD-binding domain-containing protein [Magnetospirillaceae bacterium]|jgi:3-hydroxybutyryl-CoA dehydrogenase